MRGRLVSIRHSAAVVAFSIILPFTSDFAHALPKKPPQSAPASFPSSMKLKEPKMEEDISIVASLRGGSGSMLRSMLRAKEYKRLMKLYRKTNSNAPASQPIKEASKKLAYELRVFQEAKSFEPEDRCNIVIASIFFNSGNLLLVNPSDFNTLSAYMKNIESLGFPKLAKVTRQWLKYGKGNMIFLYKSMQSCLDCKR